MSREIKFRAWNKESEIMCYDNEDNTEEYFDGINSTEIGFINHRLSIPKDDSDWYFRSRYDVMQYTGLKDKNGKEIFEGDILQASFDEMPVFVKYSTDEAAFVFVDKFARFGTEEYKVGDLHYEAYEVIGNIYEHNHLLEETA